MRGRPAAPAQGQAGAVPAPDLPPPVLVTSQAQLDDMVRQALGHARVGMDTESNSLYAYQERVCLIQLSVPGTDYVVDPVAGLDLAPVGRLCAEPAVEKVFHAAEYDVMCLRRDFGWSFASVFDTMWAARVLGWPRVGLGSLLEERFGVRLDKRWQRHNWGRRPLAPRALAYARLDTHYLLGLRDLTARCLEGTGRLEEARAAFDQVARAEPSWIPFDPNRQVWSVKGARDLSGPELAILRELLVWRDAQARRQDRPVFKVLGDEHLLAVAAARPRGPGALAELPCLKPHHCRRYGRELLQAVERGITLPAPPLPPRPPRSDPAVVERHQALRRWRKETAERRGVEPDVVVPNPALWALARAVPRTLAELRDLDCLNSWAEKTYGPALLEVVNRQP